MVEVTLELLFRRLEVIHHMVWSRLHLVVEKTLWNRIPAVIVKHLDGSLALLGHTLAVSFLT